MPCPYMYKPCKAGCKDYVCRAFFPIRQPIIKQDTLPLCMSEDYEEECPQYAAGTLFRDERRRKHLENHCPFASNTVCGHPEEWWCKGGYIPHKLYPAYIEETWWQRHLREALTFLHLRQPMETFNGKPVMFPKKQLEESCWTGDKVIYMECPAYKDGIKSREEYNRIKGKKQ